MILESLEQLLRQESADRANQGQNPWRASSMGRCIREACFEEIGVKGEPMQPRRMLTLHHGTTIHDALLTPLIKKAMGWRVVDGKDFGDNYFEIDGAKIAYHIDLAFQHNTCAMGPDCCDKEHMEIGVAEIKGWADYSFERAKKGEIDHEILCQGWCYGEGTSFNPVVFLGFRKETAHMVEVIFDRNCPEKVVTQRLTGDPIELAKNDPILLTTIASPFDDSVEAYVRERIKWLKRVQADDMTQQAVLDLVPGADHIPGKHSIEDEVISVQGMGKAAAYAVDNKTEWASKNGSWYSFKTGRKILGFPCSYCAFKGICYPTATMEMKGDKPIWVVTGKAE